MSRRWSVSLYRPARLADGRWVPGWRPEALDLTARGLLDLLTRCTEAVERERWVPCWGPHRIAEGEHRGNAHVIEVSCAVVDVDHGPPLREAARPFAGVTLIAHTTWRHTSEAPRGRIVLPLLRAIPARWWPRAWAVVAARSGYADGACKDLARLYFLPGCLPGRRGEHDAWFERGELLDLLPTSGRWEDLPETEAEIGERLARERVEALRATGRISEDSGRLARYAAAVLRGECEVVAGAGQGERNRTLARVAYRLGGYVGSGALGEEEVCAALESAGLASGMEARRVRDVIRRQVAAGRARPLEIVLEER